MEILKYTKTFESCPKGCRGKLSYLHHDQKHKTCSCGTKWNRFTNNLVINNFSIERCTDADGKNLPSNFLQWTAINLCNNTVFLGKKKECIYFAENYYEN